MPFFHKKEKAPAATFQSEGNGFDQNHNFPVKLCLKLRLQLFKLRLELFFKKYLKIFIFFQILSRTWGINLDTIACLFFDDSFFRNMFLGAYPFIPYPQKWSKSIWEISYFSICKG